MAFRFNKAINKLKNNMTVSGTGLGRVLKACMFALVIATVCSTYSPVYAANAAGVVTGKFTAFQDLLGGIISSIGSIITLWGISEWGIAFQGSEGTMQANAFKRIGGGFVMAMAPQILAAIM